MEDKLKLMKEKAELLNEAARVYYQQSNEIMTNQEYDRIYDELLKLEKDTGIVLAGSPTTRVGYQVLSGLPKENHPSPMLSLDKTKDVEELKSWIGDKEGLLSWKLDGLTIVLTYSGGELTKAVTRGDGITGEVITENVKVFDNVPLKIPSVGELVVRGEAVITYEDFEKINNTIENVEAKYKNPRNLCSGTVRQLNNKITAARHVKFFAFSLTLGGKTVKTRHEQMEFLRDTGFETVDYIMVDADCIEAAVEDFREKIPDFPVPSDGLVLVFDDIEFGRSLGTTSKFPRDSIAFKWKDEMRTTHLREMLWNVSRTGLINPIAVFDSVELEGTTVSRASVHNLSIVKELELGLGDEINVYKANMIIPQIAENITKSGSVEPPEKCPVCGSRIYIEDESGVETLHCPSSECPAKKIKAFTHFVSRNAINIEGLSEATLEKFIDEAMIKEFADIFRLDRWRERIVNIEGFGEKSYENLISSIEKASHTTPARLLFALGIPNIGSANAGMISRFCRNKWEKIRNLDEETLVSIDGIGEVMAKAYVSYFENDKNKRIVDGLMEVLTLDESFEESLGGKLSGIVFVITGKLEHYENRDEMKKAIIREGGKVASSVSSKTNYLINNDVNSSSSKNKKAGELGVPVISEQDFLNMI